MCFADFSLDLVLPTGACNRTRKMNHTYYLPVIWPRGALFREYLGLPHRDFFITLGYDPADFFDQYGRQDLEALMTPKNPLAETEEMLRKRLAAVVEVERQLTDGSSEVTSALVGQLQQLATMLRYSLGESGCAPRQGTYGWVWPRVAIAKLPSPEGSSLPAAPTVACENVDSASDADANGAAARQPHVQLLPQTDAVLQNVLDMRLACCVPIIKKINEGSTYESSIYYTTLNAKTILKCIFRPI